MKSLFLFTQSFPYGKGETFIAEELPYLATKFKTIYIFPENCSGEIRPLPANANVVNGFSFLSRANYSFVFKIKSAIKYLTRTIKSKEYGYPPFRNALSYWTQRMHKAVQLKKFMLNSKLNPADVVAYTYWLTGWAEWVALLRDKKVVSKFYSRAHGFDVYETQTGIKFFAWRDYVLSNCDGVFAVSENGAAHLSARYPAHLSKIKTACLGVSDNCTDENHSSNTEQFLLLSCSSTIALKRVEKIVDVVSELKFDLKWVHFGDGPLQSLLNVKVKSLPANISVELMGWKSSKEVIQFYHQNKVDLFINLSTSEGIPVSIMEAMSFGTPVIATKTGGVPELVKPDFGFLFDVDFKTNEISEAIQHFYLMPDSAKQQYRKLARQHYLANFSAAKNYTHFADIICAE
jgi:glycosyltransferase involved in cell wall biosynthesis